MFGGATVVVQFDETNKPCMPAKLAIKITVCMITYLPLAGEGLDNAGN